MADPEDETQLSDYLHRLPRTRVVDRISFLVERCRNQRVIHIGFADSARISRSSEPWGEWLHKHLADAAADLVGVDSDSVAVAAAAEAGYKVHAADCTDPDAVASLSLEPADIVVASEVIQYVDRPGSLLNALRCLCRADGHLIITTPNAYGLIFMTAATLLGIELNDPNHLMMFTQRTLSELARRNGWHVVEMFTYSLSLTGRGDRSRLEATSIRAVLGVERILGKLGRPFAADGLIVVAEPA